MNFIDKLENTIDSHFNVSMTENGAVGYKTTYNPLLDMNFKVASYRNKSEKEILKDFTNCYIDDSITALKWLFYVRDIRNGLGERRLFRVILKDLATYEPQLVINLIPVISEYGRYDDLIYLLDSSPRVQNAIISFIRERLNEDLKNMSEGASVSLLAKWMPSENASSTSTRHNAKILIAELQMTPKQYRKTLTTLRKYIGIVEQKMSANQWYDIDYEKVPSRANLVYNNAFLRNDTERRKQFLENLKKGICTINSSTLYPHDIVHRYLTSVGWTSYLNSKLDPTLEALWQNLPDTYDSDKSTIVVADGSGSMCCPVGNTRIRALDIANALAIYFAERCKGEFKDKYITFSSMPQLVDMSKCKSLREKLAKTLSHNEVANTNIEAVFNLILETAISYNMTQADMPTNILIISDMEFDCATAPEWGHRFEAPNQHLFEMLSQKFADHGYKLPKLIFWNVNSRTNTIPVKQNELGVALVSGFSPNVAKMIMSNETDPYKILLEILNSKRYDAIEDLYLKTYSS